MSAHRPTPLDGVRVIDMADGRGEMCGRLLSDLGADVIRVEPPGGAASRTQAPLHDGVSLPFATHNAGKRGVVIDHTTADGRERLLRLLDDADIWIETPPARRLGSRRRPRAEPGPGRAVHHRLRPHRPLSRLGGDRLDAVGDGRRVEPVRPARPRAADATRRPGAAGHGDAGDVGGAGRVLEPAGVRSRRPHRLLALRGDRPGRSTRPWGPWALRRSRATRRRATGLRPVRTRSSAVATATCGSSCWRRASGTRCARGWASRTICRIRSSRRFAAGRLRPTGCTRPSSSIFRERDKHELTLEGQARGVPIAPVLTPADVLAAEHFRARGAIARTELARGIAADAPTGFARDRRLARAVRSPRAGARRARRRAVRRAGAPREAVGADPGRARRPLEGLRVLDFGVIVLGAEAARLFCDQGAEVIKIESRAFPDGARVSPVHFAIGHRGSKGLGVNLRSPEGVERDQAPGRALRRGAGELQAGHAGQAGARRARRCGRSTRGSSWSTAAPSARPARGARGWATALWCDAPRG